jgi:protein-S-isoprenylcysteine O-methyltransferase Ste14
MQLHILRVVQLTAACVVLGVIVFYVPGPWNAARIAGFMVALPSLIMLFVARFQLGDSFAVTPRAKGLVTHGLYSKIRNPMYVFSSLLLLGLIISLQKPVLFVLLVALFIVKVIRAQQEATVLEKKFGDAYRQYRAQTWF